MSSSSATASRDQPKLLRSTYLAGSEALLRETRATGWYYFPAPIFWLIVFGTLYYSVFAQRYGFPGVPWLTDFWGSHFTSWTSTILLVLTVIVLLLLLWLLVRYLRWVTTVYAVTTHRVLIQRGIFSKDLDEIPIPQVRGVDVHQRVYERIFGFGTVRVSSETGTRTSIGNEDWHGIPKPFEFQRLIQSANQAISGGAGTP